MRVFDQRSTRLRRTSQVHGPVFVLHNDGGTAAPVHVQEAAGDRNRSLMTDVYGPRRRRTSDLQSGRVRKNSKRKTSKSKSGSAPHRKTEKKIAKRIPQFGGKVKYLPRRPSVCGWVNVFVLPGFHFVAKVLGRDDERSS